MVIQHMFRKYSFINLFIFILSVDLSAEIINTGIPYIHNYPKKEYKGGTQNWSVAQDNRGFMYFGNNDGLLQFDGVSWQLFRMPNSSVVRSVYISPDAGIYVGAYNELGKLEINKKGVTHYRSLKNSIPAEFTNFDDIWNITSFENQIVFQSYTSAFLFKNDSSVSVIKAPERFQNSFAVNGHLYFNDINQGLMEYKSSNLVKLEGCEKIRGEEIWSVIPFHGSSELLICTLNKGVFIYNGFELNEWQVPANLIFKKNQIFSATIVQDKYIAFGTIQDGLYILDNYGKIVQHINRQKGLQNNTILKLFADREQNLWLGLDNGIDYININSPITFLHEAEGIGAGYTCIIHQEKIYLGTNQGLFVKDWTSEFSDSNFKLIPGTNGQVWHLGVYDGILLCGHNNGTFRIDGEKSKLISKVPGAWKYYKSKKFPDYLICGTYSGLIYFRKQNNDWVFVDQIKGFNESCRVFEEDENGVLWMSHGFKGIFKIEFSDDISKISKFRFFNSEDGLPSSFNLNIHLLKGKIVVTSSKGIYTYNSTIDKFESSVYFNQILAPLKDISYLNEDKEGNIWYTVWDAGVQKTGLFRIQEDKTYQNISAPFALLSGRFLSGFEFIYPYSSNDVFYSMEEGFAHYSPHNSNKQSVEFNAFINRATALYLDSTFYSGNRKVTGVNGAERLSFIFPFKENSFRFSYTSPVYSNSDNIEFSIKLSGISEKWSPWSTTTYTEYTSLPAGDYIFSVKARNQVGIESTADSLAFSISPPWYKSSYAYAAYFILFVLLTFLVIWIVVKRIEISKRKERLVHLRSYRQKEQNYKRQALLAEKKFINLKNEQLQIEMIHRDKELANQTMDLIRKNKFLQKIKDELEKLKMTSLDENVKDKISSIMTKIDKDIDHKKQWEIFETAFDEVHEDFLKRLKTLYPSLTPKELKLCAYLRMNISTKEIAPLMNISVRGVEICRYRVRKKLNIDRDQNLTSMIIDL
jgi:ligand-binding sensor domain-containing protein/DNA-binding CsgD family transcriptional regulator